MDLGDMLRGVRHEKGARRMGTGPVWEDAESRSGDGCALW